MLRTDINNTTNYLYMSFPQYLVRIHELNTESRQLSSKNSIAEIRKQCTPPAILTLTDSVEKLTIHETPNRTEIERVKYDKTKEPVKSILGPNSDHVTAHTDNDGDNLNAPGKKNTTNHPQSVCESIENALQAIKARERIHMWLTSTQEQLTEKIQQLAQAIESHECKNGDGENDRLSDYLLKLHGLLRVCESDQRKLQELLGTLEKLPSTADSVSQLHHVSSTVSWFLMSIDQSFSNLIILNISS